MSTYWLFELGTILAACCTQEIFIEKKRTFGIEEQTDWSSWEKYRFELKHISLQRTGDTSAGYPYPLYLGCGKVEKN